MSRPPTTLPLLATSLGLLVVAAGCGGDQQHTIGPPRVVADRQQLHVPAAERHGQHGAPGSDAGPALAWDTPPGWVQQPAQGMRLASFSAPGDVDVSLTVLPGGGGGPQSNLDRWRQQLGLKPMTATEFASLPRRRVLDSDAYEVDLRGRYAGGKQAIEHARLLGLVATAGQDAVFVKLVGEQAAVDSQVEAFGRFAGSLRQASQTHPAPGGAGPGRAHPTGASPTGDGRLRWQVPAGWEKGHPQEMRVVTFHPGGDRTVHVYVTILSGPAGGAAANLNRWRGQVGLPPLTDGARAALPKLTVLGRPVHLLEAYGGEHGVLGIAGSLGEDSLFVKAVGPAAKLRAARDAFVQFCTSLEVE